MLFRLLMWLIDGPDILDYDTPISSGLLMLLAYFADLVILAAVLDLFFD